MRVLTKVFTAAAVAFSVSAAAGSSQALVFASFLPDTGEPIYSWVNNGPADTGTGGAFYTTSTPTGTAPGATQVHFSFIDPALDPALMFLPADFTLIAAAPSGNPAAFASGPGTWTQTAISGGFSFIYTGPSQFYGSTFVTTGSNLLTGTYTNSWIQGAGGTGSNNLGVTNGGHFLTLTSDYEPFLNRVPGTEEFAFNLLGVEPNFGAEPGAALRSFRANGGGNFSFRAVPEPAAWALMLVGFGGIGALLRSRRRQGLAFA
jgi:hypothetical protein